MEKLIQEYNSIDLYTVADNILCKWFREKYIEVYGSITHPITHYDEYSHEEIELIEDDPEFDSFRMTVGDRKNINKIFANRSYQEFCEEMSQYGPVDNFLSRICDGIIHGDPYHGIQFDKIGDEALKEHKITPGEYMVKGFNFFKTFDADSDVLKKEKILSEIRELAHDIYENVQVKIRDIGKKYEQE